MSSDTPGPGAAFVGPRAGFSAWVWDPNVSTRPRGFATADLLLYDRLLVVQPRKLGPLIRPVPPIQYQWPTVVIQRTSWLTGMNVPRLAAVLVDINGRLGSVQLTFGNRNKIRGAIEAAGFDVVEVERQGWEAPAPVNVVDFPTLYGRVPACVLSGLAP
jgi:hypothetical protein